MSNAKKGHLCVKEPSPWVLRFAHLLRSGGNVADIACGAGRHGRFLLGRGFSTVMVDRDVSHVSDLVGTPGAEIMEFDLEGGEDWPLKGRKFAGLVVVNYLHRPLFPYILDALEEGGALIYETFAAGNEAFSRPRNPDHLLQPGELLDLTAPSLEIVAYEYGIVDRAECMGVVQRICGVKARMKPQVLAPKPV